jgi:hypothetical protein
MSNSLRIPEARPLNEKERHLLARLLAHAFGDTATYSRQLSEVSVVSRCRCGCPTVDLAVAGRVAPPGSPTTILAEGGGVSPEGIRFGIILHAREGLISELEVYSLDGEGPFSLPSVEEIEVYDAT